MESSISARGKLGFGFMRLPRDGAGEIDLTQCMEMVDAFMEAGFNYFDTAFVYDGGKNEDTLRRALVERYPRESYRIATKMPGREGSPDSLREIFNTSLERLGCGYIDNYLLHAIDGRGSELFDRLGAWDYVAGLRRDGLVRHIGFSFHDSAEVLDRVLTAHPEAEFVQLQINYVDWDSPSVQSRLCLETACRHGKPVIVMEPVKGGALAHMTDDARRILSGVTPDGVSPASLALRFAASCEGVVTVLSGMSDIRQMKENIEIFRDFKPVSEEERNALAAVAEQINNAPTVPCTGCGYCLDDCPAQIKIRDIFRLSNRYLQFGAPGVASRIAALMPAAKECLKCGVCEERCPQHLDIRALLEQITEKHA